MKGISKEDFPKNCLGELSNSSSRRKTHDCFGELPSNSPWRVVQYISSEIGIMFLRTKIFCFENDVFSHLAQASVRELVRAQEMGKGESHSHPFLVDI